MVTLFITFRTNSSKKVKRQMRTEKRAYIARLSGAQFAVVTLFRKVLDLRPPPSLLLGGLPITTSYLSR